MSEPICTGPTTDDRYCPLHFEDRFGWHEVQAERDETVRILKLWRSSVEVVSDRPPFDALLSWTALADTRKFLEGKT